MGVGVWQEVTVSFQGSWCEERGELACPQPDSCSWGGDERGPLLEEPLASLHQEPSPDSMGPRTKGGESLALPLLYKRKSTCDHWQE